jgi:glyoxylase-like metal-dependent hydrolase (beta-lactamase superfamily II)
MRFLSVLLLGFLFAPVFAQSPSSPKGPPVPDYPVDRVAEGVYVIHGPLTTPNPRNRGFMNNPAFVMTSAGVVIVDPGGSLQSGEMVLRQLKKLTDQPVVAVFNSHIHGDHWLGNQAVRAAYPKATIYAHPKMIAMAKDGAGDDWVALLNRAAPGAADGTVPELPDAAVDNDQVIRIGDVDFTIHHFGTTHTPTDIMISIRDGKILFTGDNLLNGRLGRTGDGHIGQMIKATDELVARLDPEVVVPGHGHSGDRSMYDHAMEPFRIIYRVVKEQYENDVSDFEMKPVVVEALKEYQGWEEFDNLIGKMINQAYLEIEEADF